MTEELKDKKVLVLGGNGCADAIESFAKDNKLRIYSLSNDKNALIHRIAYKAIVDDSSNSSLVKQIINEEKIDGVYLGGNETIITKLCETINEIGLNCYCTKQQWDLFQNKSEFKKLCKQHGLPVVERIGFTLNNDGKEDVVFPVITKPADGCGSSGFSICRNYKELREGYKIAANHSLSGEVIVEKYVKNKGHVVFYSFSNGVPYFTLLQDKYPFRIGKNGSFVAGIHTFPSLHTEDFIARFDSKLKSMFKSVGVREGTIWIEVFHDGNNYFFNEAGFRYGGSMSIYPVDYFTGINQVAADLYYALTGKSRLFGFKTLIPSNTAKNKRHYCMYPIYLMPGTIKSIEGFEAFGNNNLVVKVIQNKRVGSVIKDTKDFFQNFGYIHFVFDNKKEFLNIISDISQHIKVLDENGNDMIIRHSDVFFRKVLI